MRTALAGLLNGLLLALQTLLGIAGFAATTVLVGTAFNLPYQPFSSMVLALFFGFLATLVHESGHWLGARLGGMTVIQAGAYGVEIQPQLRGARVRWTRRRKGQPFSGYVMAVDPAHRSWRSSRLWMIAMGPLMNLFVGVLCLGVALCVHAGLGVLLAFATINLAIGLANLVPTFRRMHSDGAQLIAWLRRPNEAGPEFAYPRLLALSVAGVGAAELPAADLEALTRQPMPMPLVALSYQLTALQTQGDWATAVALEEPLKKLLEANPAMLTLLGASIAILRRELEFSRALLEGNGNALLVPVLNRDVDWYSPALAHRCRALQAAFAGDSAGVDAELEKAERLALNSPVRSAVALQAALAGHIRAVLARPVSAPLPAA